MQRRRKKRCPNWRGGRNVELERGASGSFGITISGQKPCILSSISKNSPAEVAGLRAGDFLISINGLNVSKLQHEIIVQLINNAHPKIWLSIADNYYKSDSSDDESGHTPGSGGSEIAHRMRPKHTGNKLKGFRPTPQQTAQQIHLPNANNYELLMPTSRPHVNHQYASGQHHHNYPGPSSASVFDHSLPYNAAAIDYYGPSGSSNANSVLIDSGHRECVPSLEYKIIVGYLGTIEMPGKLTGPRLQIVRQCIKKMRQEKRQPVAVLMTILPHCMTLRNASNQVLATYAASRMSYVSNGSQSETERSQTNFGLITTAYYNANGVMVSPERAPAANSDTVVSNSCHVFMVNQKIIDHRVHFEKLSLFKIRCTKDPISNLCLEFPKDTDYVVNLIRSMYTLNVNEERLLRVARSRAAAAVMDDRNEVAALSNSPQPSNHSELTTTSSNSDSGIGFNNDCTNICDRILVVDFPGLRGRVNNYDGRPIVGASVQLHNPRPTGISTERDLCPIEGISQEISGESRSDPFTRKDSSIDLAIQQQQDTENKLTVRAMPFPKKSAEGVLASPQCNNNNQSGNYEERAVDVPADNEEEDHEFVFRAPTAPGHMQPPTKSAKQRLNFFASKLSPKVFGASRSRIISQSCENISTGKGGPVARRQLSEDIERCTSGEEDEYIDIWGSVSEVNEQDCKRLYSEIDAQRQTFLEGATSEPNINAMAKSLADDLIENCGNFQRPPTTSTTKTSPFRRYGQISSSFRSQLTATEAKKMLTSGNAGHPGQPNKFPARPRSFASSEGDVYYKSDCMPPPPEPSPRKTLAGKEESGKTQTRVIDWNTSFEVLLGDTYGVHAFAEFLRKEFSAENIYFWTACERYKQLDSAAERFQEAQVVFARHLENGAPEPVNIDSKATSKTLEQLQLANSDLFDAAQKQIFNLMKFDSYARFIKSDIYKQCLECEMKKLPPPYPENRVLDVALSCTTSQALQGVQSANGSPVKLKKSLSNAEDRRRKSLLPWHRKTRSKSKDRNEEKKGEANGHHPSSNIYSSRSSLSSFDAVLSVESTDNQRSQLCRVILPNGATTIVQTRPTETIRELVVRLLEKRGLSYTCFEVFVSESSKPCDLECMSTRIAGKQVNIEQRVTFKLDLPNKKVISVKSKPEKVLEEVLRPILFKYHYSLDEVQVNLRDSPPGRTPHMELIKMMVTEVDGRRLIILDRNEEPPKSTLHEITSRVFNEILPEHQQDGRVVSVKKLADYMNCRFAGQQMVEGSLPRKESTEEESDTKRSVIAKWTAGARLQSPTVASVEGAGGRNGSTTARDQLRATQINFEMPAFLKNEATAAVNANERPTPAPRLSITKSSLQTSLSSMNNSQDSGILSNRSVLSNGTASSNGDHSLTQQDDLETQSQDSNRVNELDQIKSPPPPLPPKPKVLPIRGPNWGSQKHIFLDQPPASSSFV